MAYKVCKTCNKECGVRTPQCSCGTFFNVKSSKKEEKVQWKTIATNSRIRLISGYGPHIIKSNSKKEYINCPAGIYTVKGITDDSLIIYSDKTGRRICYMGETKPGIVGIKEAHEIRLIK